MIARIPIVVFALLATWVVSSVPFDAGAGPMLVDDFNDGDDAGWTHIDYTTTEPWGPGTYDASSFAYDLRGLAAVPMGSRGVVMSLWNESSAAQFQEGFVRATMSVTTNSVAWLALRVDTSSTSFYVFGMDPSGVPPVFFHNKVENGAITVSDGFDIPGEQLEFGEEWIIEAGVVGETLSMKAWKPGQPEPLEPQWTRTDSSVLAAGQFGLAASHWDAQPPATVSAMFDDVYFTPIPEPSTIALAVVGLCGMLLGADRSCRAKRTKTNKTNEQDGLLPRNKTVYFLTK